MANSEKNGKWMERLTTGLLCAGFAAGVSWGLMRGTVTQTVKDVERHEAKIAQLDKDSQTMRELQARIDEHLNNIDKWLESISDTLHTEQMNRAQQ